MEFHVVFKKTLQELINELDDIIQSGRYDVPSIIKTDLQAAAYLISSATSDMIIEIMQTFGKFVIQFEKEIKQKDVAFFNRLEVCKCCNGTKGNNCVCLCQCKYNECHCDAKCANCSDLLADLDSKTFNAIKYIIGQAVEDPDMDKKEDIDVIFNYISSLLAAAKNHKKR